MRVKIINVFAYLPFFCFSRSVLFQKRNRDCPVRFLDIQIRNHNIKVKRRIKDDRYLRSGSTSDHDGVLEPVRKEGPDGIYVKKYGAVANEPGHLCNPCGDKAKCSFCGEPHVDAKHVCKDKLAAMKYVCGGCGRVAMESEHLCKPSAIA